MSWGSHGNYGIICCGTSSVLMYISVTQKMKAGFANLIFNFTMTLHIPYSHSMLCYVRAKEK